MATSLWHLLENYKIVIPIIQRDYAQGRQTGKVPAIRERFLNALCSAIEANASPLELDFVYGYIKASQDNSEKSSMCFIPLDGQQRLTTLFLLHWFVAVKENHFEEAMPLLSNFTYETRHSSRVFCEKLVKFKPDNLETAIMKTIINQPWFFTAWKNDPTISSMLIMLNAIQEKFKKIEHVWPLLTSEEARIVFHLLPMEKLGLPDDLYIKMNSRGKELTEFEHFKSRFSEILSHEQAVVFNNTIDQAWSDLFWDLYKDINDIDIAKRVDNAFLRFFRYVTDLLIAQKDIVTENQSVEFVKYHQIYNDAANVDFLFSCLNIFCSTYSTNPGFFDSVFYIDANDFIEGKTRLFFQNPSVDLFKKCADNYDATLRVNQFSIGEQLLLYACIVHIKNKTTDFNSRIRKLRNLIANSEDTVRNENMYSLLITVSEIILNNKIDENSRFNKTQAKEEEEKEIFLEENISFKGIIHKLEDHHLLQGCLAIFNLEDNLTDYAITFHNLFTSNCNYDTISTALLCFGDYSQKYDWRRRFGNHNSSVWRELFTPSQRRSNFIQTKDVLYTLMAHLMQNPESDIEEIILNYLTSFEQQADKPKDWKYYFIKYLDFRHHVDGFYTWWPKFDKPYECLMMRRTTLGGFHWSPFLFTLNEKFKGQLSLGNMRTPLVLVKGNASLRITNVNQGFHLEASDDESKALLEDICHLNLINSDGVFQIRQTQEGEDIEDRIEKGVELISKIIDL